LGCTTSKEVGAIYKVKHYVKNQALRLLYHSSIKSRVKCGIIAWRRAASYVIYTQYNRAIID